MKIAFTSCTRYEAFRQQPEWKYLLRQKPDFLFLLGDNIYMDWITNYCQPKFYPLDEFKAEMLKKYQRQWDEMHFKAVRESFIKRNGFYGIWDDHDFAWDNACGGDMTSPIDVAKKEFSRNMFHHFFNNCSTNQPEVYYAIDTPKARVIFLDNRYYAQEPGGNSTILGEAQFQYIAEKLVHNLEYTVLCGGLTLTSGPDSWRKNYPNDLQRLSEMLTAKSKLLFLAGDIHKNEFISPKKLKNGVSTPPQIISSGMQIRQVTDRHNWAVLDFQASGLTVNFFQSDAVQKPLTDKCNQWLRENGY
ncbi:MAG: alkaline phosphatase D family protein [Saprospiraceae bacterium]|nr:alkaline phosphatase D family protein [Saprospiraceae bacterium]